MKQQLFVLSMFVAICGVRDANAFDLNQALGVQTAYMCDTGDGKRAAMLAGHPGCGRSKADKGERWRFLSKGHCALNDSLKTGDPEKIKSAAEALQATIGKSKMYKNCYSTMKGQAKDLAGGYDAALTYILTTAVGAPAPSR